MRRLCPIFQVSNVTGQGLDYVCSHVHSFISGGLQKRLNSFQLRTFLNLLPPSEGDNEKFSADQPLEVRTLMNAQSNSQHAAHVHLPVLCHRSMVSKSRPFHHDSYHSNRDSFNRAVPYVGTVVDGILNSGSVKTGDAVLLGPDANGNFLSTVIKSIQRKR